MRTRALVDACAPVAGEIWELKERRKYRRVEITFVLIDEPHAARVLYQNVTTERELSSPLPSFLRRYRRRYVAPVEARR